MKVLMLNGSPRKDGCTYTALGQIAEALKENGTRKVKSFRQEIRRLKM